MESIGELNTRWLLSWEMDKFTISLHVSSIGQYEPFYQKNIKAMARVDRWTWAANVEVRGESLLLDVAQSGVAPISRT